MCVARCWVVRLLYIHEQGRKRNETSLIVIIPQSHSSSCTAATTASALFLTGAHVLVEAIGAWIEYFQCTNDVFARCDQMLKTLALALVHFHFRFALHILFLTMTGAHECSIPHFFFMHFAKSFRNRFRRPCTFPGPGSFHALCIVFFQPFPSPMHVFKPHLFFMNCVQCFSDRYVCPRSHTCPDLIRFASRNVRKNWVSHYLMGKVILEVSLRLLIESIESNLPLFKFDSNK